MNVMTRPRMSLQEFLAWEAEQERKWEYDGHGPVEVTGRTRAHALIQVGLLAALHQRLEGTAFEVFGSELKIQVGGSIRYPEAFVAPAGGMASATVVHDPIVVFEVLSPSTERTDRTVKRREYAATPSIQRYVLLEQGRVAAMVFERAGAEWMECSLEGGAVLDMPKVGVSVPLAEFYKGLLSDINQSR